MWADLYAGQFFYQLYFQQEGVEFEADVRTSLRKIYFSLSGDRTSDDAMRRDVKPPDATYLDGLRDPDPFPGWLTDQDLDYYADAFSRGGFRGPTNRYRNHRRDWELLPQLSNLTIVQPSCFIAGALDRVRSFTPGVDFFATAGQFCSDFRGSTIIEGEGHWIQQEAPVQVNAALLRFLRELG